VLPAVSAYRRAMQEFAALSTLEVWYARLGMAGIKRRWGQELHVPELKVPEKESSGGRLRDNARMLERLTVRVDRAPRLASHPPWVTPVELEDTLTERVRLGLRQARESMPAHARSLLDRYKYMHAARKVVGVGGVGPSTCIVLLTGRDEQDLLFLQVKEAQESVLEPYLGKSHYANSAERVVEGQRLLQKANDIFLGWGYSAGINTSPRAPERALPERAFYVRQLWDWKTPVDVEAMSMRQLLVFGQACGWILARAHARSGDRVAIASYLGKGPVFDEAIAHFAAAYAAQNQRDHHALCAAIASGRITARPAGD
jgi:hypothetical protein